MKLTDYKVTRLENKSKCPICEQWFLTMGLSSHFHASHNPNAVIKKVTRKYIAWNKGLDKSDPRIAAQAISASKKMKGRVGRTPSEEQKKTISESMKKAHAEGRAHNIGSSRWKNEPSYPEKFFMKVIENEFQNKNYSREFSFGRFSLDFAWVEKKLCIEIDGEQHKRFKEYHERDERKDKALHDAGWRILRIEWKEMFNNTKYWIEVAKTFIDTPL